MTPEQIENRLAALEKAVSELQTQLRGRGPAINWLERITGSFKDEPAFEDVLRYGREFRQADRPPEGGEEGA
jgi:hypothetical protein